MNWPVGIDIDLYFILPTRRPFFLSNIRFNFKQHRYFFQYSEESFGYFDRLLGPINCTLLPGLTEHISILTIRACRLWVNPHS